LVGSPSPFRLIERAGDQYARVENASLLNGERPAFPSTGLRNGTLHTVGSPDRVQLADRSMKIELATVPAREEPENQIETANRSRTATRYNTIANRLEIQFEANNETGQPVRLNASWLEGYGIRHPIVEHEDGTRLNVNLDDGHYVVYPEHFSFLYVFNDNDEGYNTETDQPYSEVDWNSQAGAIDLLANRRDSGAEITSRDLATSVGPDRKFTATVDDFRVLEQGHWQNAYPLVVAEQSVDDVDQDAMSFYIRYQSRGGDDGDNPHYIARYVDADGNRHTLFEWTNGDADTVYELNLSFRPGFRELNAEIRGDVDGLDNDGQVHASGTHTLEAGEDIDFDKIAHASRGSDDSFETQSDLRIDTVGVAL